MNVAQDKRAIVFLAWGKNAAAPIARCLSGCVLPDYPVYLITDTQTDTSALPAHVQVVATTFSIAGNRRKSALLRDLPDGLETVLFLDIDKVVIDDVSLGFDMAEKFGIAIAQAPHYDLGVLRNFKTIMEREGVPARGQIVYNSGVIFFSLKHPNVAPIFAQALRLAEKYEGTAWGDQPFLSLAMELADFHPYARSPSYNYRGFGEIVSGSVRIWHSYHDVPKDAANLEHGFLHCYEQREFMQVRKVPK